MQSKEEGWKFVRWGINETVENIFEPRQSALRRRSRNSRPCARRLARRSKSTFDIHTRLDLPDAVWLCREVEQFTPFFIEDPLRSENPDSFKTLAPPRPGVPLAAGEQFCSKWEFRQMIEEEWIDYARIDLCIVVALPNHTKIAGWCETHYINVVVHNPLGSVSSAACLHLDLAAFKFWRSGAAAQARHRLTDVFPVQPEWEDGYLLSPTRPGLGIEFDREAAKKYPAQSRPSANLRRLDGSFTNW